MGTFGHYPSRVGLDKHGIIEPGDVYWNLSPAELYEHALRNGDGALAENGVAPGLLVGYSEIWSASKRTANLARIQWRCKSIEGRFLRRSVSEPSEPCRPRPGPKRSSTT